MKNTILKYKKEEIGDKKVRNYFSKNPRLNIREDFPKLAKYLSTVTIEDNTTPEKITNEVYENTDLWDFLLIINEKDPLFDMPYDYDTLRNTADRMLERYMEVHPRINITEERKKELLNKFVHELDLQNEKNRIIEGIEPRNLSYVITTLRQAQRI